MIEGIISCGTNLVYVIPKIWGSNQNTVGIAPYPLSPRLNIKRKNLKAVWLRETSILYGIVATCLYITRYTYSGSEEVPDPANFENEGQSHSKNNSVYA